MLDDDDDVSGASLAGEKGSVQLACNQGPKATAAECVVLEDAQQENRRVVDHGRDLNRPVVVRLGLRAEEGGKKGHKGKDIRNAAGVVL